MSGHYDDRTFTKDLSRLSDKHELIQALVYKTKLSCNVKLSMAQYGIKNCTKFHQRNWNKEDGANEGRGV